jgi:serine/threonine-protein kinase
MNYTLKSILGEGGMAIVHLAEDHKFHTEVALKMLKKEFVTNENIKKRFLAEARSMFRMSHPNVIKVTDLIDEGDTVAFVMEYVEGETLKEYVDRKGKLTDAEIKDIFSQMLDAVGYVHEQQLVHRDIKPSNFMLDKRGKVKLMDFGIAKKTDPNAAEYTQTSTGMQMGTPMYMSPEQITETNSVTAQSDIYSLGVVLWQLVTGQKPYDTKTLSSFQLQTKIVTESLAKTNTHWDKIIHRATAKEALNRYKSCKELNQEMIAPPSFRVEDSDATQIEVNRRVVVKEKNPRKEPQIKSKPAPEKLNPIGALPQKTNSNTALYLGVFVTILIGALILFLMNNNNESSEEYLLADSTAIAVAADSASVQQVTFTNNSSGYADLSIAYMHENEMIVIGWYSINSGESFTYDLPYQFLGSEIFWLGIADDGTWTGTDGYFYIERGGSSGFKVVDEIFEYSGGGQKEKLGFNKLFLTGQNTSFTLSD